MPAKITTMTAAQAARLDEWARKWIEIGLSTVPADFDRATAAALRAYELCNLGRPIVILRMGSPYAATIGGILAHGFLREFLRERVWSQVWSQVRSQVWSQVESQLGSQVGSQVESQVGSQVGSQVWSQVWSQVESQVWSQVRSQVGSQVESQVGSQVESQGIHNDRGGAFWASWCAYISFFRDVLGWTDPTLEPFKIDEELTQSCGWVWWHENVLSISDRPSEIHRDARGRLHSETGPSIAYRDGWALHHWHGVLVPDWVIEAPSRIKTGTINAERNAEVRRVLIERYGQERYLVDDGAELVASDRYGELYRKVIAEDEPLVMVKVKNSTPEPDGSVKDYFLRVPPTMRTPQEAVAWTFGMKAREYAPAVET